MKPIKEDLLYSALHSFRVKHTTIPYMDSPWHYHPEFELIYIIKGNGTRFVGDVVENFYPGDMLFLGDNLPHVWKNSEEYYKGNPEIFAEVIVIQFKKEIFGKEFFNLPELIEISKVLDISKRGLKITGTTHKLLVEKIYEMVANSGVKRIVTLLSILDIIAKSKEIEPVTTNTFHKIYFDLGSEKIKKVFEYVSEHFRDNIQLEDIAELVNMSKTAFCRHFKNHTTKTFLEYLNSIRINYACKLLLEGILSISQISYECGFKTPSYFNKQFKEIMKKTPNEYRAQYNNIQ